MVIISMKTLADTSLMQIHDVQICEQAKSALI
jgi:hypothetical protein